MRKSYRFNILILAIALINFIYLPRAQTQTLFQNSNEACESEAVICSSVPTTCIAEDVTSVSCKNFYASTDFDGDGFVDCAASSPTLGPDTGSPNRSMVNILMNRDAGATDCSSGTGDQFFPAQNELMNFGGPAQFISLATLVTGLLNGDGFSDLALAGIENDAAIPNSDRVLSAFSPGAAGFPSDVDITASSALWPVNVSQSAFSSNGVERNTALIDCNGDSDLDLVTLVLQINAFAPPDSINLNVLLNNGSALQDIVGGSASFDSNLGDVSEPGATLAVADFDNDGDDDLVIALNDNSAPLTEIGVCLNDGNCGFSDCASTWATIDLNTIHPGASPLPISIAAGDFNDDGNADAVITMVSDVTTPGDAPGVDYFFGNGANAFNAAPFQHFDFQPVTGNTPGVITTGCFNNDNVVDVAFMEGGLSASPLPVVLGVITSAAGGSLHSILTLTPDSSNPIVDNGGIDAADFDNQGGDDIIALATRVSNINPGRHAFIFMNSIETLAADAGSDLTVDVNTPVTISGASCSVNPEIPGDPASFDVAWTVAPPVGSILAGGTTLTPTFTAAIPGTYTLTLTCTTRCDDTATDTMVITVPGEATPSPVPLLFNTQGGCITNSLIPDGRFSGKAVWAFLLALPLFLLFRRIGKKMGLALILLLGLCLLPVSGQALTKSFSVNTFEPTIDDSEYFTVYSSPTMLQRNYHMGFYLDYARDPYEFSGANNNNRIGGIVDDLLTGNIVGSYAIKDWFSVGLLIPVYFWEGIRSTNPALLLNENNFDLGDIQVVLKFRLLDRERHHVGISVIPFLITPTSTGSSDFLGEGAVNGGAKIVIDGRIKDRVSLALNLGFTTRSNVFDIAGNELDDQFLGGLGISVDILKKKLKFIAEAQLATTTSNFFSNRRTMPAEARGGFRYTFANNHDINAGAGFGLSNGIGSPAWRGFVGYSYTKRPIAEVTVPQAPISEVNVGDELTLQDKIYFEFDKAVIRDISKPTLDKVAGFLKAHPEVSKIKIEGNTCDLGTNPYNQRLSERRAKAVVKYLEDQGISADRIGTVLGYGETHPIVPNSDEAHREQNRRVQIFVEAVNK